MLSIKLCALNIKYNQLISFNMNLPEKSKCCTYVVPMLFLRHKKRASIS